MESVLHATSSPEEDGHWLSRHSINQYSLAKRWKGQIEGVVGDHVEHVAEVAPQVEPADPVVCRGQAIDPAGGDERLAVGLE